MTRYIPCIKTRNDNHDDALRNALVSRIPFTLLCFDGTNQPVNCTK